MACNYPRVAYLGPPGTYTHQATAKIFNSDYCLDPTKSIPASGDALYGIVPISNSTRGLVRATLAAFMDVDRLFANVRICGEIYVCVNHCLMGHKPFANSITSTTNGLEEVGADLADKQKPVALASAPDTNTPAPSELHSAMPRSRPLVSLKHVTTVYSHEQALSQCTVFLDAYLRHAERVEVSSTSRAAELACMDKTGASTAISSVMAADIYNIDVLAKSIQNAEQNATGFYVLRKAAPNDNVAQIPQVISNPPETKNWKGFIHFTVAEDKSATLGHLIKIFTSNGVDVVEIHSQPREGRPFGLDYFMTLETMPPIENGSSISKIIEEASREAETFKWLGYWPKVDWRKSS
ncbi:prephenate dehydratase [Ceratocystis pirilliformis]|uniref:prephenate dehydratase n=1 Tax=Ceratocystis pirilliformis TaxID=259994 RepID=A0ABR3Z980_9PEZI